MNDLRDRLTTAKPVSTDMASQSLFRICFFLAISLATTITEAAVKPKPKPKPISVPFNRSSFPHDFLFGSGSAAYQSEGAALQYGRGPSIWDTFTRKHPEKIFDRSNGDVADDLYHRYKSDIQLMKKIGLDSFRFSISWSRVLPTGKVKGGANQQGVQYYNNFINELLANGLTPYVTIFHWDVPQTLEDEYGGFRSYKIVEDYREYSDFLFKTFGDRVKYWTTLNEPYSFSINGYNGGTFAPSRCSSYVGNCTEGNSATEPYIVGHNLLLSHAAAVKVYKQKYQKTQKGAIGVTLVTNWFEPKNPTDADRKAASQVMDFFLGWYLHPITYGNYPETMQSFLGNRLPKFTPSQSYSIKGSIDFLGLNYYTTNYVEANHLTTTTNHSFTTDLRATLSSVKNGVAIGSPTVLNWLYIYPRGIRELALYVKDKYKNPPMYITENGVAEANNNSIPVKEAVKDSVRIRYLHGHLSYLLESIKKGANVKGYFQWAFFDDFEWDAGYTVRFGIVYVDFKDNLKRYLKYSGYWYKRFLLKY